MTVEYGKYLSTVCTVCHGDDLSGGSGGFAGGNITPGSESGRWSEAEFMSALRTGVTPSGDVLDPEDMPWRSLAKMTDDELKAVWIYIRSLPPVERE